MGTLRVLGPTGDTEVTWNPATEAETQKALERFDLEVGQNKGLAFRLDTNGQGGEIIKAFEPDAEEIIVTPAIKGG